ncbi:MAG: hypothetical protein R3261_07400, partial [Alphaproteobacteria bacterium]|nr:hypothetical protein [Alphaproteobacteria bacterium]
TPYKETIIKGVNMVARTNDDCYRLEAGSAGKSGSRGTQDDPAFFVTCYDEAGKVFNVFFSKSQVAAYQG